MTKIVINTCYGGFCLSQAAYKELGLAWDGYGFLSGSQYAERDHPKLVEVVERLGSDKASGEYGYLQVVEIPDDVDWVLKEYDGREWISEKHRTWS